MKYEAPELTALMTAINAIQSQVILKGPFGKIDNPNLGHHNETNIGYQDWE